MLGRFWKVKGPGIILVYPIIQQFVRVDLRTVVLDVPTQDVISRDNVSVQLAHVQDSFAAKKGLMAKLSGLSVHREAKCQGRHFAMDYTLRER